MDPATAPIPFQNSTALRAWFKANHGTSTELWIRFYRLDSKTLSVTYPDALDEALCVGWIDGVRKRVDDESYIIRFTPRKPKSTWSAVNIRRVEALIAAGRMTPAGLAAFEKRDASAVDRYSYENRPRDLPAEALAALKRDKGAWAFWREQPAGYRRAVAWWVVSAKGSETRQRRIRRLVAHSRKGNRIPPFVSPAGRPRPKASRRR